MSVYEDIRGEGVHSLVGRCKTFVIGLGAAVEGVEGLWLGVRESEMLEESLLGLVDLLEDF